MLYKSDKRACSRVSRAELGVVRLVKFSSDPESEPSWVTMSRALTDPTRTVHEQAELIIIHNRHSHRLRRFQRLDICYFDKQNFVSLYLSFKIFPCLLCYNQAKNDPTLHLGYISRAKNKPRNKCTKVQKKNNYTKSA